MAGPGQRDVGEPQVLAALLTRVLLAVVRELRPLERHVDRPRVAGLRIVEEDRGLRLVGDPARLPQERQVDDRELEPLAAMDRQHLDRLGVRLEPAAALLVAGVESGLGDPRPQPRRERRRAELLVGRGRVQQLPDVAQVGQLPLAVLDREHPRRQALAGRDRRQQRGDASPAQDPRPVVQPAVDLLPRPAAVLVGARELVGRPAEERRQRRGVRAGHRRGALERLEQRQPVARRLGREHAAGAVDHRRHAGRFERVADHRRLAVGPHEHRQVAGPDLSLGPVAVLRDGCAGCQQRHDVGGQVADDVLAAAGLAHPSAARQRQRRVLAQHDPDPQRRADRRVAQPRAPVRGAAWTWR